MNLLDDWRDIHRGRVRVETGEPTDEERRKMRQGSILVLVGFTTLALSGDYLTTVFVMSIAGVFVNILLDD